jgi:hypothetical protein
MNPAVIFTVENLATGSLSSSSKVSDLGSIL